MNDAVQVASSAVGVLALYDQAGLESTYGAYKEYFDADIDWARRKW